ISDELASDDGLAGTGRRNDKSRCARFDDLLLDSGDDRFLIRSKNRRAAHAVPRGSGNGATESSKAEIARSFSSRVAGSREISHDTPQAVPGIASGARQARAIWSLIASAR